MPSEPVVDYLMDHDFILPFKVAYVKGEILLVQNQSGNEDLQLKNRIEAINGVSMSEKITRFYQVIPREGLQTNLTESYINQWFRFWYHLHYGHEEEYVISYVAPDGMERKTTVVGNSLDEMRKQDDAERTNALSEKGIYLELIDDSLKIAKLNIRTFDAALLKNLYDQKNFKKLIDQCFETVFDNGVEHLILDIRDNSGGNPDYSVYLLEYLFDQAFTQAIGGRVVKHAHLDDIMERSKKRWMPLYGIGSFKPKEQNFSGSLYMLTNGGTFSAAVEFATTIDKYDRAIIIGNETGGNGVIMGGNYLIGSRKLSNTKIVYYAGNLFTYYRDISLNKGRGVIPDYQVSYNIDDILSEDDLELTKVLSIIKKDL